MTKTTPYEEQVRMHDYADRVAKIDGNIKKIEMLRKKRHDKIQMNIIVLIPIFAILVTAISIAIIVGLQLCNLKG